MTDKRHLHRYVPADPSHRPTTLSELAILQKHHQFIRNDDDPANAREPLTWEDKLAKSWYDKLFREFALCDLSRYKEGGVAMRWRTEQEVLDRIGELTCGELRCKYHTPTINPSLRSEEDERPLVKKDLDPYQLNFQYQEQGKIKNALVKVVLCERCKRKLTWKKDRERERKEEIEASTARETSPDRDSHRSERQQDSEQPGKAAATQESRNHRERDYERPIMRA